MLRPWGPLSWILGHLPGRDWSLLATLAAEERCGAVVGMVGPLGGRTYFLRIHDPGPPSDHARALDYRWSMLPGAVTDTATLAPVQLFADLDTVASEVGSFLGRSSPHVLLDISSMPKRWFFPAIRFLMADDRVQTLIAAYASPDRYGPQLAYDPRPIQVLPGFPGDGTMTYEQVIIGIGFAVLGLSSLLEGIEIGGLRLLFPFPPGPPSHGRNWMAMRDAEAPVSPQGIQPPDRVHVNAFDCPQVFDAIRKWTGDGASRVALAPYGPKTMSLAMCLFSLAADEAGKQPVPAYYAQPTRYALPYSSGVRMSGDEPDVQAYCLKLNGRGLYTLPF